MLTETQITRLLDAFDLDDMIGQMLCYRLPEDDGTVLEYIQKTRAGSFFISGDTQERIQKCTAWMNEYTKAPGMIAADIENGPEAVSFSEIMLPHPMAWGACGDADLIERAHDATAARCRELGAHWSFSPLVDINFNMDNPVVNIRAKNAQ